MGRPITQADVVFAALPFADFQRPVIGASLLQAGLHKLGFQSRIEYFNIAFAEVIGTGVYELLASGLAPNCLAGEWFFADLVFGDKIPDAADYLTKILSRHLTGATAQFAIL